MKFVVAILTAAAFLFAAMVSPCASEPPIHFPPEALRILANEVTHLQRPNPDRPRGGWRWSPGWPGARMRSVDLAVSRKGELWFTWVKFHGDLWQDWRSSLFVSTPGKRMHLRDTHDCLIADPTVALDGTGGAVVMWREYIPIGPKSDLLLAKIARDGKIVWGPLLIDHQIREAAIALDQEGRVYLVASPGNPSDIVAVILPREHFCYTVSAQGELTGKTAIGELGVPRAIALVRDAEGRKYFSWMDGQVRYVARIQETEDGQRLGEGQKMVASPEAGLDADTYFGHQYVLRGEAFFDRDGTLIVDNLVFSRDEQEWKIIRVEHKPENPVPGTPTPTIFIDPEGGLHISTP